jgi:ubiquinone/menaquinone biosynthesis C-methylase UbiE
MKEYPSNQEIKKMVAQGYDRVADRYARLEGQLPWPRMKWLQKVLDRLEPGCAVLDLGCGSGDPADIEIARHHHITGVDISKTQIELARKNVPGGTFIQDDLAAVQFPPESFQAVVSFYTLEHLPRREHKTILQKIFSWLKPGGFLLIALEAGAYEDETGEWLGVPMFFSAYDPETMVQMVVETGYQRLESAIEIQVEGSHEVPFLWILGRKPD